MPETDEQEIAISDFSWQEELPDKKIADLLDSKPEAEVVPSFICECNELYRSACTGLPFYREHDGKRYCVLHYPSKDKADDFRIIFSKKMSGDDFNFSGAWIPKAIYFYQFNFRVTANFSSAIFNEAAEFRGAIFTKAADFRNVTFTEEANFRDTKFTEAADFRRSSFTEAADFRDTKFTKETYFIVTTFTKAVNFDCATFTKAVNFKNVTFAEAVNFRNVTFAEAADFTFARFAEAADFTFARITKEVDLRRSSFKDYAIFENTYFKKTSLLKFQPSHIEEPDRVFFHTVNLRPHWFINTKASNFEFTNVEWTSRFNNKSSDVKSELEALENDKVQHPHRLLARACRQLAVNAEENNRYEEASHFRFMAMEAQRLETWHGWAFWKLRWWYWLASGYGERTGKAAFALFVVWFAFALMYTQVGFEVKKSEPVKNVEKTEPIESPTFPNIELGNPLTLPIAMNHSINVMALQRPEPKGQTVAAKSLVTIETILGPLQAALLALAIRRKFMR